VTWSGKKRQKMHKVAFFQENVRFLHSWLTCRLAAMKYRSTKKNKIPSGGITIKNQILARAFMVFTGFNQNDFLKSWYRSGFEIMKSRFSHEKTLSCTIF